MLPGMGIAKGACTLWQEELLLDYTIEVEDEQFKVHKVILASVSDYFKVMLTGGMRESSEDSVRLEGHSSLAISNMIQFIYTGQFGSPAASPEELLSCAVYLQIPAAIAVCTDLLCDEVNEENCFDILSIFRAYLLKDGIKVITEYIRCHRDEAILKGRKPQELCHGEFLTLMDYWGTSEWELFLSVKQWIDVDNQNRLQHLDDLMSRVRFALMTPEQLEAIKDMDIYSDSEGSWCELVAKANEYHGLPTHQKVVDDSVQSRVRGEPSLVCLATDRKARFTLHQSNNEKSWAKYETNDTPELGVEVGRVFEVNNFLVVDSMTENCHLFDPSVTEKWHIFDPRIMKWSPMANLPNQKSGMAIVSCNKYLYALGGYKYVKEYTLFKSDCIRRYAFETNKWRMLPAKLPHKSKRLGAGVINGNIYVAAARQTDEGCTELDCYRPSTDTWRSKAPMLKPNYYDCTKMQVLELWNEEVLFIMRPGFFIQYYSPSTDQWSIFNPLPHMDTHLVYSDYAHVHACGNAVYFFNSKYEEADCNGEYHDSRINDELEGACAKWTFQGQKITETRLGEFRVPNNFIRRTSHVPALISITRSMSDN